MLSFPHISYPNHQLTLLALATKYIPILITSQFFHNYHPCPSQVHLLPSSPQWSPPSLLTTQNPPIDSCQLGKQSKLFTQTARLPIIWRHTHLSKLICHSFPCSRCLFCSPCTRAFAHVLSTTSSCRLLLHVIQVLA